VSNPGYGTKIILIVEDDAALREHFRLVLSGHGYAVTAVGDGEDALRRLEYGGLEAVVLDLGLPRVDGRDVYRELQANPATRNLPVVVVTGSDVSPQEANGFRHFLRKPVSPEVLVMTLDNAIRRRV
jgi:two-component system, OmpR family, response regulator